MKFVKSMIGILSTAAIVAPLAVTVSCSAKTKAEVKYVAPTFVKGSVKKIFGVTDGGDANDHSFNSQTKEAVAKFSGEVNNFLAAKSSNMKDIIDVYNQAIKRGAETIVGAGYRQVKAMAITSTAHPEKAFIIADWQVNAFKKVSDGSTVLVPQGNVASITYRSEEAGFLAGLEAANYASEHPNAAGGTDTEAKVATFGAMDLPPIRLYMEGFKKGVDRFNEQATADKQVKLVTSKPGESDFIGNLALDPDGKVTQKVNEFIHEGVDVIFPVGGDQELSTMNAIWDNDDGSAIKLIGIDTDMTKLEDALHPELILGSAVKNIKKSFLAVLANLYDASGAPKLPNPAKGNDVLGKNQLGTLSNGWVGYISADGTDKSSDFSNKFAAEEINVDGENNFH